MHRLRTAETDTAGDLRTDANASRDVLVVATGAGVTFGGRLFSGLSAVVVQVLLARFLGPAAFGLYSLGYALLAVLGNFSPLGLDSGAIKFGSPYWKKDGENPLSDIIVFSLVLTTAAGGIIGLVLFGLAPWLEQSIYQTAGMAETIRWMSLGIIPWAVLEVAVSITRITRKMHFMAIAQDIVQPLTALLLLAIVMSLGWGLPGAIFALIGSLGFATAIALLFVQRLFRPRWTHLQLPVPLLRNIASFSFFVSGSHIFFTLLSWIDRLILGAFRPVADVGVYQSAAQVSVLFPLILSGFNSILTPFIPALWDSSDHGRLESLFRICTKWGLYLTLPLFAALWCFPESILQLVFGAAYAAGATPLRLLALGQLFNVGTGAVGLLLMMTGHQRIWTRLVLLFLGLDVALNLALAPALGLAGVAAATSLSTILLFLSGLWQVRRRLHLWPYDARNLKSLIAFACAFAVCLLLSAWLPAPSTLAWLACGFVASYLVFGVLVLILGLDAEDIELLSAAWKRLRKPLP